MEKTIFTLKNTYFVCELPDVTCQTTGRYMSNNRTLRPVSGLKRNPCYQFQFLNMKYATHSNSEHR